MSQASLAAGDVVRLGPTAREKHCVLDAPKGADYIRVRQCSTGKVREVRRDRCVIHTKGKTNTND